MGSGTMRTVICVDLTHTDVILLCTSWDGKALNALRTRNINNDFIINRKKEFLINVNNCFIINRNNYFIIHRNNVTININN